MNYKGEFDWENMPEGKRQETVESWKAVPELRATSPSSAEGAEWRQRGPSGWVGFLKVVAWLWIIVNTIGVALLVGKIHESLIFVGIFVGLFIGIGSVAVLMVFLEMAEDVRAIRDRILRG